MLSVRNLHTFTPDEYGNPVLSALALVGSVDTDAAGYWGIYGGDPAVLESGNMDVMEPFFDPDEGVDPYSMSHVDSDGGRIWHFAGSGIWYRDRTVQVGLIYEGADIGSVSVDIQAGANDDGYYAIDVTYPSKVPAPRVVWLVDASYMPPEPEEPAAGFWTNFRKCREVGAGPGGPPAGSGGGPPKTAAVITGIPYSKALGVIPDNAAMWFKVTLAAGTYRFHTTDSPGPTGHDTHIALFSAAGAVIAENDDVGPDDEDYRSSITKTLAAGTYYVAISGWGAEVGAGFLFSPGGHNDVPAGAIFKVEAA